MLKIDKNKPCKVKAWQWFSTNQREGVKGNVLPSSWIIPSLFLNEYLVTMSSNLGTFFFFKFIFFSIQSYERFAVNSNRTFDPLWWLSGTEFSCGSKQNVTQVVLDVPETYPLKRLTKAYKPCSGQIKGVISERWKAGNQNR